MNARGNVKVYQAKIVARRRKKAFFISLYALFAFGLVGCLFSYLSQLSALSIDEIVIQGNVRVPSYDIRVMIGQKLEGNYAYFFSPRNIFLYPKGAMEEAVLALPLVKSVDISRDGFNSIVVSVTERKENARWCEGEAFDVSRCFSVDENGFIFATSTSSSTLVYRGLVEGNPIRSSVLSTDGFKKTDFFVRRLSALGLFPQEVLLSQNGYMSVLLSGGGKLIINTDDDLSIVLENVSTVLESKSIAPSTAEFLHLLDYMKLDLGNKVVYKLKTNASGILEKTQ